MKFWTSMVLGLSLITAPTVLAETESGDTPVESNVIDKSDEVVGENIEAKEDEMKITSVGDAEEIVTNPSATSSDSEETNLPSEKGGKEMQSGPEETLSVNDFSNGEEEDTSPKLFWACFLIALITAMLIGYNWPDKRRK